MVSQIYLLDNYLQRYNKYYLYINFWSCLITKQDIYIIFPSSLLPELKRKKFLNLTLTLFIYCNCWKYLGRIGLNKGHRKKGVAHWWVVNGDLISVQSSVAYIHSLIVINNPESRCRFWKELTVSSLLFAPPLVCPSWRHLRQAFSFKSSSKVRTHARRLSLSLSLFILLVCFSRKK